jgi:predicted transcriptional regulator
MNSPNEVLNKLREWLKHEYKITTELESKSHDNEEKKRLYTKHNTIRLILEKLDELENNY